MAIANSINQSTTGICGFTGTAFTSTPVTQYNVITGSSTSSTLNNVAPSATSGVPLISSGAAVQPAFGTMLVAGGGTGNTTFTAYSVICAGTTATGTFQNVSGLGSSTQVLISNGAAAFPTWQTVGGGAAGTPSFVLQTSFGNPADSLTYYLAESVSVINFTSSAGSMGTKYYMPVAGTINKVYGNVRTSGTLGSAQNVTLAFRKNDTTNTNISTTLQFTAVDTLFNHTSLGISVAAGDFIEIIMICPIWTTNPLSVKVSLSFTVV